MFRRICFIAAIVAAITAAPVYAATGVGGTITTTTWTKANGPYRVTAAVTVPSGNTLTIEPGVDVLFDTDVQFIVEGRLHAVGTQTDSIRFLKGTAPNWRGIRITGGDTSTIAHTRISDGKARGSTRQDSCGGALYLSGKGTRVSMSNSVISGNSGSWGGGLFPYNHSTLTLTNCRISGNSASYGNGGGLFAYNSSTLTLTNCTISGNSARDNGGGLYAYSSTVTLTNCTISGNRASPYGPGGGLDVWYSTVTLTNCTITGNSASYYEGGGLYVFSSTARLTSCAISGNSARWAGGLYAESSWCTPALENCITLTNCTISGNWASYNGGGLSASSSTVTLANCTITGNSAVGSGGGVYNPWNATVTLTNCTISRNTARDGGGLCARSSSTLTLTNCTMSRNTASRYGSGLYADGSTATLRNTILWANGAQEYYNASSTITATYSDIYVPSGVAYPGTGNINANPLFVDAANGDYHLEAGSPARGMGAFPWPVAVTEGRPAPRLDLWQNSPNPFNPSTTIRFTVPQSGPANVAIYDVNGRLVRTLVDRPVQAGFHELVWDGRDQMGRAVASGVYLYRLTSGEGTLVRRMTLVR